MPPPDVPAIYASTELEVDVARRELRVRGAVVPLGGRAFEIIEVLARADGQLVSKDDLIDRVWPGAVVEENTLHVHISAVRKALGVARASLRTESGRGYRLLGRWTIREPGAPSAPATRPAPPPPAAQARSNLPAAAGGLVGRAGAIAQLRDLVSAYRAVTLTGPGGIGKTTLALEVARDMAGAAHGDAWLVELVSLSDPALVPSAVAAVLGLQFGGDRISAAAIARAIGATRMLLVLDNCEHLIDATAELVETIIRHCSGTSILATSREVLRVDGEHIFRVPPLDVPPLDVPRHEAASALDHSAVQLFVARTAALQSGFTPDAADLRTIAAICRRLDGIPLAIEFAAARAASLGLEHVLTRLDDRFALLAGGRRTALPRHQTLRATLDWSYQLLPEVEQRLLCRLAVFPSGFTLEAATAVMRDTGIPQEMVVETIANLVAKSLVALDGTGGGGRWRLLETIRAYALEKLAASGEAPHAARRHAEFFRDLVAQTVPGSLWQPTVAEPGRYAREIDNVRAALDWAFSPGGDIAVGLVLTAAYAQVWMGLSLMIECRERTERALESLQPGAELSPLQQLQLYLVHGVMLLFTMGSAERGGTVLARAVELADSVDAADAQLQALWALWNVQLAVGDCRSALLTAERFCGVAARTGEAADGLVGDRLMGQALHYAGRLREAQACFERVLAGYAGPTSPRHRTLFLNDQRAMARVQLSQVLALRGLLDQAAAQAQASVAEAAAADHKLTLCWAIRLAVFPVAVMAGDLAAADRAVATLTDIATSLSTSFWTDAISWLQGRMLILRGEFEAGVTLLRRAFASFDRTGWTVGYPEFMGAIAEGLTGLGQYSGALATIAEAMATTERSEERWYDPELLRLQGEVLLAMADRAGAEACFLRALELAGGQAALFWELRAALSLARLRGGDAGRQVLAAVYQRCTEGLDTADMRAARELLAG